MSNRKPVRQGSLYKVQRGDNLWSLAERAFQDPYSWEEIKKANPKRKWGTENVIFIGEELKIPFIKTATVKRPVVNKMVRPARVSKESSSTKKIPPAFGVGIPGFSYSHEGKHPQLTAKDNCGTKLTLELFGDYVVHKPGTLGDVCKFDIGKHEAVCTGAFRGFLEGLKVGYKIDKQGDPTISLGTNHKEVWLLNFKTSVSVQKLSYSATAKPKKVKIPLPKGFILEGEVGVKGVWEINLSEMARCVPPKGYEVAPAPMPAQVPAKQIYEWLKRARNFVVDTVIIGLAAIAVVAVVAGAVVLGKAMATLSLGALMATTSVVLPFVLAVKFLPHLQGKYKIKPSA
jgi:LysM repeat protein